MTFLNKISLRMRITLLTGSILIICSIILTMTALHNANVHFGALNSVTLSSTELEKVDVDISLIEVRPGTSFAVAKKQFNTQGIIMLAIVCVFGTGMVYIVAGKSLRPIQILSQKISMITEKDLHKRIEEDRRNDEVAILRRSFNKMFDRLEDSFLRQKRFSANVAHELKTPLTIISTGMQVLWLEDNPSADDYKKTLSITERNVKRLISVVDDLLSLCDEREVLKTDEINVRDLFVNICRELSSLTDEKNIDIQNNCTAHAIYGNSRLIYRAFFNLLENAIKYNRPYGKISIDYEQKNNATEIMITDTGNGIPKEEVQNIFEPFYRVNKSRSRKLGGAGLGLSIVKMIFDNHGWEISVDSKEGIGSVFTINLNVNTTHL